MFKHTQDKMIVAQLVFVLLLIVASFEITNYNLPGNNCPRIVSTPNRETRPLIFGRSGMKVRIGLAKYVLTCYLFSM